MLPTDTRDFVQRSKESTFFTPKIHAAYCHDRNNEEDTIQACLQCADYIRYVPFPNRVCLCTGVLPLRPRTGPCVALTPCECKRGRVRHSGGGSGVSGSTGATRAAPRRATTRAVAQATTLAAESPLSLLRLPPPSLLRLLCAPAGPGFECARKSAAPTVKRIHA